MRKYAMATRLKQSVTATRPSAYVTQLKPQISKSAITVAHVVIVTTRCKSITTFLIVCCFSCVMYAVCRRHTLFWTGSLFTLIAVNNGTYIVPIQTAQNTKFAKAHKLPFQSMRSENVPRL